ncbi:MAG: magnesium-translocating P-type ATPase [Nanoarchaeota archaeon]
MKEKGVDSYASLPVAKVFDALETSSAGLTEREAAQRLARYGPNHPVLKKPQSALTILLRKFLNPLTLLLIIIGAISLLIQERISAAFIFLMVAISVFLDFLQEYRSGREMESLGKLVQVTALVIRDKKATRVDIKMLVPGDVVDLAAGDVVPADLRLISCKNLYINQAALTGESFPVEKSALPASGKTVAELHSMVFMGSSVVSGTATGIVVASGKDTHFGEISAALSAPRQMTSFERGIKSYTWLIIRLVIAVAIIIFAANALIKHKVFEALLFAMAVAVGLTPEMLSMILSVNLSRGASTMAKKKVVVKHLSSIQNLGAMDVLCTDKTGTITMDKIVLEKHCDVFGKESEEVLRTAYINSAFQTGLSNLLDKTILQYKIFDRGEITLVDELPFDFQRKIMSVIVRQKGKVRLIAKGSPEEVFKRCSRYQAGGKAALLSPKLRENVRAAYESLSKEGFRVIAVAAKEVSSKKEYTLKDETDLTLVGYLAFLDPPKPDAKEAILALKQLGIEVKVVTGDNEMVTAKICKEVGLDSKGMITGDDLERIPEHELQLRVEAATVFARLTPVQKERVIHALQKNGHTVGYLGDGINDAPTLKAADVGISVNNAVDIAKETADIILLEKSLMVLQDGVLEGRRTFENTTKYIKMGESSNFGNMASMTGASLFLPFLPMTPIQILLNTFFYDLSQMTISTDNVDAEKLRKPKPWDLKAIKRYLFYFGPLSSIFDFATFAILLWVFKADVHSFQTAWFLESLCTQALVIHIIRTDKIPFLESRPSRFLVFSSFGIVIIALMLPFTAVGRYLGFVSLPPLFFAFLGLIVAAYLALVAVVKMHVERKSA